jgi:amino acid transporter
MDTSIREVTTVATIQEKKKLRRELRLLDMVFITTTAVITIDTLGAVSSNGGQALTWLLISAVTYFLPYGLLTAELGSTFSQEGGVYEWCKLAFGRFYATIVSMFYWISNPLWLGGTLAVTAIIAIKTLWFGNPDFLFGGSIVSDAIIEMVIALIFIWGTIWSVIVSLHSGKLLSVYGSYIKLGLFALFIALTIAFAISGQARGGHLTLADLAPSTNWALIVTAILPALIFNWGGFEVQNGAGEEMRNPQRDVPRSVIRSGLIAFLAYAVIIAIILFTLSKGQLNNATGFISAYQIVESVLPGPIAKVLGILVAIAVVFVLASSGGTWIMGADRTYAISALDRTAPVLLGRFSGKYGTPIVVNILSGIFATITMAIAIIVTATNGGSTPTLFALVLGFVISTTTLSYMLIFPAFLVLRYKYPKLHRPYKVPGGMIGAWIVTLLPFAFAALASYVILIPTDATVSSYTGISRTTYELTQIIPLAVIVLLAVASYVWGQMEKRNQDVIVDVNYGDEGLSETDVNKTGVNEIDANKAGVGAAD